MFGNGAGFTTLLVMTGTTSEELLDTRAKEQAARGGIEAAGGIWPAWKPNYKLEGLACLKTV